MFENKSPNPMIAGVLDVTATEVNEQKGHVRLIDVRQPPEWSGELGHIPEAELITLDTLPDRIEELPKDQTLVIVCRSGNRSAQATSFLKNNGFEEVYNMAGGMIAWNEEGYETADKND